MRVFVTGATGFIGSAVVQELLSTGYTVLGLARSEAKAEELKQRGTGVHRGDLSDPDSLATGARACDGVLHLAFVHDWVNTPREVAAVMDRDVAAAMTDALAGTDKPFVLTSGTAMLPQGKRGTEGDAGAPGVPRVASEETTLDAAGRGVRSSVLRLPPTVHGAGDAGFVPMLIDLARRTGVSAYPGDGANVWPAVHRLDAARLFRLALEQAKPGTRLHAVAEEGIPVKAIAEAIGAGLSLPVRSLTGDEAAAHFGGLAEFIAFNNPTSSALTRETFGWTPIGPELLTDMRENGYFS